MQTTDPLTYKGYAGAMASFIQTGDPNAHKLTNSSVPGVPGISFGQQFLVNAGGLANGPVTNLKRRCDFWLTLADKIPV